MRDLIDTIRTRVNTDADGKGARDGKRNAQRLLDAIYAQQGACWICGDALDDSAQLDRIVTGRALGLQCACTDHCRCGYLDGNVGAAHRECHAGGDRSVRDRLAPEQTARLVQRYVPTRDEMRAARVGRRAQRGRVITESERRLKQAVERAG